MGKGNAMTRQPRWWGQHSRRREAAEAGCQGAGSSGLGPEQERGGGEGELRRVVEPVVALSPMQTPSAPSSVGWCADLPWPNRLLLLSGTLLVLGGVASAWGPAVAGQLAAAARPYTAEGKQEICASRMRSVALALAAYAQDHEGRFPPLDYQNPRQPRVTWVSLLKGRGGEEIWNCPEAAAMAEGQAPWISSYVMNPVLATARTTDVDEAAATLMLADGAGRHDVSLLPPYPTWPSFQEKETGQETQFDPAASNVSFRHSDKAPDVYVDGHAGSLTSGSRPLDANLWGGSAVFRRSRDRLAARSPQAAELLRRLQAGRVRQAASFLRAHRARLRPVSQEFVALWRLNSGEQTSDSVEEVGWNLARAWEMAGDTSWIAQLNQEQTKRCREQLQQVRQGEWGSREVSGQPTLRCEAPAAWTAQDEREGRYRRLYIRSPLPSVYVVLEVGDRNRYVTPRPINWDGSEDDLRRRYGREGYRRLHLSSGTLAGNAASVWEYEVQKPGGPCLRKRYIGYTDGWTSYIAGCTAPAKDWALWKPEFYRLLGQPQTG